MRTLLFVLFSAGLLACLLADESKPARQIFTAGKFSLTVTPDGIVEELKNGGVELVSSVRLDVNPVRTSQDTGSLHAILGNRHSTASVTATQEGAVQRITIQGCLANAFHKLADYTEILHLSPEGIKLETTVTLSRDIQVLTWANFKSLLSLPNTFLDGRTVRIMNSLGVENSFTFPENSSRQRYSAFFGCKAFVIEMPSLGIKIADESNAYMLLSDEDCYESKKSSSRLLIFRPVSVRYSEQPILLEAGTVLKWAWSIGEES